VTHEARDHDPPPETDAHLLCAGRAARPGEPAREETSLAALRANDSREPTHSAL